MPQVALKDIEKDIETALRKELVSIGLDHVELRAGIDHDGDAAVFVTAILPSQAPAVPGGIGAAANVAIARVLDHVGDERLSYLYLRRPDDERAIDEATDMTPSS